MDNLIYMQLLRHYVLYLKPRTYLLRQQLSFLLVKPQAMQEVQDAITGPLSFSHGPIGNQVSVICKKVQLLNPTYAVKDGIPTVTLELNIVPFGAGNNEISYILQ